MQKLFVFSSTVLFIFTRVQLCFGKEYLRICFFPIWGQDRGGNETFTTSSITDPSLCTHIMYSFARVVPETNSIGTYRPSDEGQNGGYKNITNMKRNYPHLKIILDVGGWNHASKGFVDIVSSYSRIRQFSINVFIFLTSWGFDGLDLDWEYPAHRGGKPSDKRGYTILVKTLRETFETGAKQTGNPRLLLSASVSSSKDVIDKAYEIDKIARYVDFLGIMPFDFFGKEYFYLLHHSALFGREGENSPYSETNMHYAIQYYISKGAPREKIVFGVPFYSRALKLVNTSLTNVGAPQNGTDEIIPYHKICQFEKQGWKKSWHKEHKVPYVYNSNLWIAYDDEQSLEIKVNYIRDNNLLGFMAWEMSYDDFSGNFCGQGKYPLLNSLKRFLQAPRDSLKPARKDGVNQEFDEKEELCKNCSSNPDRSKTLSTHCSNCSNQVLGTREENTTWPFFRTTVINNTIDELGNQDAIIGGVVGGVLVVLIIIGIVVTGVKSDMCSSCGGPGKGNLCVNTAVVLDELDVRVQDIVTPLSRVSSFSQSTSM